MLLDNLLFLFQLKKIDLTKKATIKDKTVTHSFILNVKLILFCMVHCFQIYTYFMKFFSKTNCVKYYTKTVQTLEKTKIYSLCACIAINYIHIDADDSPKSESTDKSYNTFIKICILIKGKNTFTYKIKTILIRCTFERKCFLPPLNITIVGLIYSARRRCNLASRCSLSPLKLVNIFNFGVCNECFQWY